MSTNLKERTNNVTQHNYHDHSNDEDESSLSSQMMATSSKHDPPISQTLSTLLFPAKLHRMLSQIENDGFDHIISWQPHGRCFVIHNPDQFKAFILPRYFDTSKISSFQRQLSLYGFTRLSRGKDRGGYYHELFLRGKPSLLHGIIRTKVKGTRVRGKANPESEPNLWLMSWVGGNQQELSGHDQQLQEIPLALPCSIQATMKSKQNLGGRNNEVSSRTTSTSTFPSTTSSSNNTGVYYPTSSLMSLAAKQETTRRANTSCCNDDMASFAGRNFHFLDSSPVAETDAIVIDFRESELTNIESISDDSILNDGDFANILESIVSTT